MWQTQPKGTETRRKSQPLLLRSTIVILDVSLLDEVGTYAEERNPARGANSEELCKELADSPLASPPRRAPLRGAGGGGPAALPFTSPSPAPHARTRPPRARAGAGTRARAGARARARTHAPPRPLTRAAPPQPPARPPQAACRRRRHLGSGQGAMTRRGRAVTVSERAEQSHTQVRERGPGAAPALFFFFFSPMEGCSAAESPFLALCVGGAVLLAVRCG